MSRRCGFISTLLVLAIGCADYGPAEGPVRERVTMRLTSPVIQEGRPIPKQCTCDGEDASPRLEWSGAPQGTQSFALICEDPDAPGGVWTHWVLYNLPRDARALSEGVPTEKLLAQEAKQGVNDFRKIGYGGPCPPPGKAHRYFFTIYALDSMLKLKEGATKRELEQAMKGHIVGQGRLMGTYSR